MSLVPATCPVCQTPAGAQETACTNCGLVFGSQPATSGAAPPPPTTLPPVACPQCAQPAPAGALVCGACGASLIYTYEALKPSQSLAKGRYTVQRALSKGGMGAIYLATDHEAFDRTVVVKAMLDYFDPADPQAIQAARERFLHEARTLSSLRHPAIPQIFTYFQDGPHNYIVMEYVEGHDLEQRLSRRVDARGRLIRGQPYPQTDVLRWGMALCRVLEYLASRSPNPVVHHDIKPANLLLDSGSGDIRLVDFGTAKARLLVQTGGVGLQKSSIHGTQGYAAPEQYRGESEARSDVYALAATLYHLATDDDPRDHPFDFPQLKALGAFGQVLRAALNSDVAQRPGAATLYRQLESLLVLTSARPLEAPDGAELTDILTLAIWCEQNWKQATSWLYGKLPDQVELWWGQTRLARDLRAIVDQHKSDTSAGLDAAIALLDPRGFGMATPRLVASVPALRYGQLTPHTQESQPLVIENISRRHVLARLDLPSWIYTSHHISQAQISLPPGGQTTLQLSAYGSNISVGGRVRDMVVMRDANAKLLEIEALTFISRWWMLLVFGRATLRQLPKIIVVGALLVVLTMCCGGGRVVEQAFRGRANAGHYQTGVAAMERGDWQAAVNAFTQVSGSYFDSGERQRESYYWLGRAALGREAWPEARAALQAAGQFSDATDLLKRSYRLEAEKTGRLQLWIDGHRQPTTSIAFSPDAQMLASSSDDGTIKLWRMRDGALLYTFGAANGAATHLAFNPDGTILMASDGSGITRLWRVGDGKLQQTIGVGGTSYSPDRTAIAALEPGGLIKLWRIPDGKLLQIFALPGSDVPSAVFSSDGETLGAAGYEILQYWRIRDGALLGTIKPPIIPVRSLAFSPVGTLLALGGNDGHLQVRPLSGDPPRDPFQAHGGSIDCLAFSPDAKLLASGGGEGIVKLWRLADDKQLVEFPKQGAPIRQVVFSPDGQLLATGDDSGAIIIWRVRP